MRWASAQGLFIPTRRACLTAMAIALALAPAVQAAHSIPSPRRCWDIDNDLRCEILDGARAFSKGGTGWSNTESDRLYEALATWRTGTEFRPTLSSTLTAYRVYKDGTEGGGTCVFEGRIAINCTKFTNNGTFQDLYDSDIYMNPAYFFHWLEGPPSSGIGHDARGMLTHELGHAVHLKDLYGSDCPPGPTMCGTYGGSGQSYDSRTLTSDDVNAANTVYQ